MSKLLAKMLAAGSIKSAQILDESKFFTDRSFVPTDIPALNVALSGDIDGGLSSGLTVIAGESKTFKTCMSLYMVAAYLNADPDAVCVYYDSEFGSTDQYLKSFKVPTERVIHVPIENIEQLKFDIVKRLDAIERGDKYIIFIDSLGNLASKKEVDDAMKESEKADMTRAKQMKSLFRMITPALTTKDIPCVVINHTYKTQELYSKDVVSGGTGIMYSANTVWIITKAQEKEGSGENAEQVGYRFTIRIEKSRFLREKSKIPLVVRYEGGIDYASGLVDLAEEGKYIAKPTVKARNYMRVDRETGELLEATKIGLKEILHDREFWAKLFEETDFKAYVKDQYAFHME